jgi:hypothetical protein
MQIVSSTIPAETDAAPETLNLKPALKFLLSAHAVAFNKMVEPRFQ